MPVNTAALKTSALAIRRKLLEAVGPKLDLQLNSQTPDTLSRSPSSASRKLRTMSSSFNEWPTAGSIAWQRCAISMPGGSRAQIRVLPV